MALTHRQQIRGDRAATTARAKRKGINVDDLKRENRDPAALQAQLESTINEGTPRQTRQRLLEANPPAGAFDGTNTTFTLPQKTLGGLGVNILVYHVVATTSSLERLDRTDSPAPAAGSFFYDGDRTIRVGTAPAVADAILAVFLGEG